MAQRRMFSPQIVESDAFLDMPSTAQLLYFHLGMFADDDGFVNPKRIMKMIGSAPDDLSVLVAKRFVFPFNDGVVVIKHWRINNLVRKDWYRETSYLENKKKLYIKKNMAYTMDNLQGTPLVNELLTRSLTEDRIDQDRIDKREIAVASQPPFVWSEYIKGMDNSKRLDIQLIGYYFKRRKLIFDSKAEVEIAIRRHLRAARDVSKFGKSKVFKAMDECDKLEKQKGIRWTLETVLKNLTK